MSNHPGPGIERAKIIQDIADRNTIIQKYIIGNHFCRQFFRSPIDLSGNRILGNIFINLIRNNFRCMSEKQVRGTTEKRHRR